MTKYTSNGFTLFELLIVIVIVGIISSLAVGNFSDNVVSSRRTDGRTAVLNTFTGLEKCKAVYGTYNNANCSIGNGDSIDSPDDFYAVQVTSTATTFTLTAAPKPGSSQLRDTNCTSIILDNLSQQTGTGVDPTTCW